MNESDLVEFKDKDQFIDSVIAYCAKNPEVMFELNQHFLIASKRREDEINQKRTDSEWALVKAYHYLKPTSAFRGEQDKGNLRDIKRVLADTWAIGGSQLAEDLKAELELEGGSDD